MHVLHDFSAASHYSYLTTRLAFKLRGLHVRPVVGAPDFLVCVCLSAPKAINN